jgi:hypothetical protein
MRYLRKYNEMDSFYQSHEHKSEIEDILLELKDTNFNATCLTNIDKSGVESFRVHISRETEFNWNDISDVISRITGYMKSEGYQIVDFTCKDDVEFKENPDDYEVKKTTGAYFWNTDSSGKIKSELKDVLQVPNITQTSVYHPGTFDKIQKWTFDITFEKKLIDKTTSFSKFSTNEELKPSTYLSAADKLRKMGHSRRPDVLKAWAEEMKKRETELLTKKNVEESKKLGIYQIKIKTNKKEFIANAYLSLSWINDTFSETVDDFRTYDGSGLYLQFSYGLIPADAETLDNFVECLSDFLSPYNGIWWLQDMWICVSGAKNDESEGENFVISPNCQFEGIEISTAYFANRQSAMKFKQTLFQIFNSEIIYGETPSNPGGMAERIREEIVGEHGFGFDEYLRFVEGLKQIRVNTLYRD